MTQEWRGIEGLKLGADVALSESRPDQSPTQTQPYRGNVTTSNSRRRMTKVRCSSMTVAIHEHNLVIRVMVRGRRGNDSTLKFASTIVQLLRRLEQNLASAFDFDVNLPLLARQKLELLHNPTLRNRLKECRGSRGTTTGCIRFSTSSSGTGGRYERKHLDICGVVRNLRASLRNLTTAARATDRNSKACSARIDLLLSARLELGIVEL